MHFHFFLKGLGITMLHTIINLDDVFYDERNYAFSEKSRSSNPYDYIRAGWFVDNADMFRGVYNVNFNSDYSGDISGYNIHISR